MFRMYISNIRNMDAGVQSYTDECSLQLFFFAPKFNASWMSGLSLVARWRAAFSIGIY